MLECKHTTPAGASRATLRVLGKGPLQPRWTHVFVSKLTPTGIFIYIATGVSPAFRVLVRLTWKDRRWGVRNGSLNYRATQSSVNAHSSS